MVEMTMLKKLYIALALFLCAASSLSAQVRPRVAGLESDKTYMSLLEEELKLRSREDSLVKVVAVLRDKLRSDRENLQIHSQNILKLEGDIFDIRNNIGRIAGRTSAIEQEFILKNLGAGTVGAETATQPSGKKTAADISPDLTANPYFKDNMPAEDYAALKSAGDKEKAVTSYRRLFDTNYGHLSKIVGEYSRTDNATSADSLWTLYIDQKRILAAISDSIATLNNYIFDTKVYSYTLLLDLMNEKRKIDEFSEKSAQVRSAEAQLDGNTESVPVSAYPLRKRLMLDYETTLAGMLSLNKALDSLQRASKGLGGIQADYPPISLEERIFIDYEPITIHTPSKYNAANPIPDLAIYDKGTVYRILLGSFLREQPVSLFRGAYPIGLWRTDEGRYNYYAGGFATQEEAREALAQMQRTGFKAPKIALWNYGDYSLPDETQPPQTGKPSDGAQLFRIDITGSKGDLSNAVKSTVSETSPGKDIMRIGTKFTVGTFTSEGEAEKVAAAIRAADPVLEVSVTRNTDQPAGNTN